MESQLGALGDADVRARWPCSLIQAKYRRVEVRNGPVPLHLQGSEAPKTGIHGSDFAAILGGLNHLVGGREWHGWRAHHADSSKIQVTAADEVVQYHSMSSRDSTSTTLQGDITDKIYKTWSCVSAFFRSTRHIMNLATNAISRSRGKKPGNTPRTSWPLFEICLPLPHKSRRASPWRRADGWLEWGAPVRASAARHSAAQPSSVMGRGG